MGWFSRSNSSDSGSSSDSGRDSSSSSGSGRDESKAAFRDRMAADCREFAADPIRSDEERAGWAAHAVEYEREAQELRGR